MARRQDDAATYHGAAVSTQMKRFNTATKQEDVQKWFYNGFYFIGLHIVVEHDGAWLYAGVFFLIEIVWQLTYVHIYMYIYIYYEYQILALVIYLRVVTKW